MDMTDPATLLDTLDADRIAARLEELEREAKALRVLLRSARARQRTRQEPRSRATGRKGGDDAAR